MSNQPVFDYIYDVGTQTIRIFEGYTLINLIETFLIFVVLFAISKFAENFLSRRQRMRSDIELRRDFDISKIEEITLQIRDLALKFRTEVISINEKQKVSYAMAARFSYLEVLINRLFKSHIEIISKVTPIFDEFNLACSGYDLLNEAKVDSSRLAKDIELNTYVIIEMTQQERRSLPFEKM